MTRREAIDMAANPEGAPSDLDYWLYGVVKVAQGLGNVRGILRAVQEETIRKLVEAEHLSFPREADPSEILRVYNRHLDDRGILDADDIAYHREGGRLTVTVGASCPYRGTCDWLHEEEEPVPCFRAIAMGEALRLVAARSFEGTLTRFGVPCHLTFRPVTLEETDHGN